VSFYKKLIIYLIKFTMRVVALAVISMATYFTIQFQKSYSGLPLVELFIEHWDLLLLLNFIGLGGMVILDWSYREKR